MSANALYLTGLIRQTTPAPERDRLLEVIAGSDCAWAPVPANYLVIDVEHKARLEEEIITPFAALPRTALPICHTS